MNVRIIAGRYGGRVIEGSGTKRTHPMGERVRGAIFNKLANKVQGARVLDAFAGSGALGLEALSRGAKSVTFIERDRVAQKIIENNIEKLGVEGAKLVKASVSSWFETTLDGQDSPSLPDDSPGKTVSPEKLFDIIFVDPPYNDPQLSTVFKLIRLLQPNGLMVLSYVSRSEVPTGLGVVVVDNRSYGNAAIAFYSRKGAF